jgi:hypothetical protein
VVQLFVTHSKCNKKLCFECVDVLCIVCTYDYNFFASHVFYFRVVIANIVSFCQHDTVTDHCEWPQSYIMFVFILNFNVEDTEFFLWTETWSTLER